MQDTLIIGISGRSCSGKSTLANELHQKLKDSQHIDMDKFILNSSQFNCKSPNELEIQAINDFQQRLIELRNGKSTKFPIFDFNKYYKLDNKSISYNSTKFIIVEGTLVFWDKLRDLMDIKVFVDVPNNVCLQRRLDRHLESKHKETREYEEIKTQIVNRWKIISEQWDNYLEPLRKYADIIIPHPQNGTKEVLSFIQRRN